MYIESFENCSWQTLIISILKNIMLLETFRLYTVNG